MVETPHLVQANEVCSRIPQPSRRPARERKKKGIFVEERGEELGTTNALGDGWEKRSWYTICRSTTLAQAAVEFGPEQLFAASTRRWRKRSKAVCWLESAGNNRGGCRERVRCVCGCVCRCWLILMIALRLRDTFVDAWDVDMSGVVWGEWRCIGSQSAGACAGSHRCCPEQASVACRCSLTLSSKTREGNCLAHRDFRTQSHSSNRATPELELE
jgi:hypothetical protein